MFEKESISLTHVADQSEVRALFRYDKELGRLYWQWHPLPRILKRQRGRRYGCLNDKAGGKSRKFRIGKVYGIIYSEHQLVLLYHKGYIPERVVAGRNSRGGIKHLNGDILDNRIENLIDDWKT